ncbi:receptor-like protein 15 isoform X3 [Populus trichocarpa]|uniref:receptor-like protein 15 isoform X3 n=1 Tax=Populus trichocarpa TaxID=3694 RepID=UPI002279E610|nr:receptor-like protein 15 isoform X3 [Populus trichocarpa]
MGLFLQVFTVLVITVSLQGWLPLGCLEEERIALLHLKDSLNYPNGTSLPSWIKADAHCCDWESIVCNSSTGRVTRLYLDSVRNQELGDWYLNASLFLPFQQLNTLSLWNNSIAGWVENKGGYELSRLSNLEILDLGSNSFDNSILSSMKGFSSLKLLYLDYNRLEGLIDLEEYLSSLETLYLGGNNINKLIASRGPSNLSTLSLGFQNLSSLKNLYLDSCSLDEHSLQSLGALPSLKNLSLQALIVTVPYGGFLDLKNLEYLDLSYNTLNNSIFQAIGTMTSLRTLILQSCRIDGQIPTTQVGFFNLKNLEFLDLSSNTLSNNILQTIRTMPSLKTLWLQNCSLNGQLPTTQGLCDLNHLQELYMYDNDLIGFLPPCLANMTSLQRLYLSSNHLKIPMSLSPLYNLSKLKSFYGSGNEICAEEDDHNLTPKFQLESLSLSNGGQNTRAFPKFLYHQFSLQSLDLTNFQIKGEFPNWLIENNTYLKRLSLENCSLSGPFLLPKSSHVNLSFLSISMNHFQGQIPSEIRAHLPGLEVLLMSDNGFNGSIPSSLGNMSLMYELDLSNNSLQGQIPGWIGNMSSLEFLDLSRNNLSGPLPPRFNTSSKLRVVYLSRNKLQGPIAMAFYDSSEIFALDLSHNDLTGRIPEWIGRLSNLRFLLLSYNNLEGEIPIRLCRLDQLTVIDLSHNYLSGNILSWMISTHPFPFQYNSHDSMFSSQQSFEFTTKNVSLPYKGSIIQYLIGIDFSCNNFTGNIPPEIGNLSKIKALNLSHNSLTGPIPPTFWNLKEIESLDLSYNKLDGEIPPRLTELFSLEVFSVAHNNLSGKTPARVAQFATFDESCYKDNPFLCGEPLPKICAAVMPPSSTPTSTNNEDHGGFMNMEVFYVTFWVAYIMVLLVIGAVLYINPYWRRAWFHFIEVSINNCYYFLVDNLPILSKFGFS